MPQNKLISHLRQLGERLTVQRRMVIETLVDANQHVTVQELQQQIAAKGVTLTEPTVYRILQWLNDLGLVSQTDLGKGGCVYEPIADQPHHHLICLNCGGIINVEDDVMADLRARLREKYHFAPRIDHMAIFGVCEVCQH